MFDTNLQFTFEESPIVFDITNVNLESKRIYEKALSRAKKFLVCEAELLESIMEVDRDKTYEKYGETYLTPFCMKHLGLSQDVAGMFVRVARKSQQVPEIKTAIADGRLDMSKARAISSVITPENQEGWIEKAQTLSKQKLEAEVAKASPANKKPEKAKATAQGLRLEYEIPEDQIGLVRRVQDS